MKEDVTQLFAQEIRTFEDRLPEWLAHDVGRFALIKGQKALGPYDTQNDAIAIGYQTYGNASFFVREVLPFERQATFTRDVA
jgi:hypothetical protein